MEQGQQSNATTPVTDDKSRKTIADYVGDMLALESHIEEALDRQLKEAKDDPQASSAVQQFHDTTKRHREALKAHMAKTGGTAGNPIKAAGSALLGAAAGVINLVRTEGLSKGLRDDYTAFNLACISYTMLHTTATALGDQATATLAQQHLTDYAGAVQQINHLIPDVVVRELQKDDHQVNAQAAQQTRQMVDQAWKTTSQRNTGGQLA